MLMHAPFHPDFPADSPYITSVGGTDFKGSGIGEETAWSGSGGGFSNYFGIPDFQKDAVSAYKASPDAMLPPQNLWNKNTLLRERTRPVCRCGWYLCSMPGGCRRHCQ